MPPNNFTANICDAIRSAIRFAITFVFIIALVGCGGGGKNVNTDSDSLTDSDSPPETVEIETRSGCGLYTPYKMPANYLLTSSQNATRINSVLVFNRPDFAVIRGGQTVAIRHHPDGEAQTEHDYINWNENYRLREAVQPGDVLKILTANPRNNLATGDPGKDYEVFETGDEYTVLADNNNSKKVYFSANTPEMHRTENRYLAVEERTGVDVCGADAGKGKFIVPVSGENKFIGDDGFLLRGDMRDLQTEEFAFAAGGFWFAADSDLQRAHVSRSFASSPFGESQFQLQGDIGYKVLQDKSASFFYRRARLSRTISPRAKWYAQFADGAAKSDGKYRNARLRGFAIGALYKNLFRHNDSYHAKIESPLADESLDLRRIAFAAVFGSEDEYVRMNLLHRLQNNATAMQLFYQLRL